MVKGLLAALRLRATPSNEPGCSALVCGYKCRIDTSASLIGAEHSIRLGDNVVLQRQCTLDATGGQLFVGARTIIFPFAMLMSYPGGNIELGHDCTVNPFSILYGHGGLKIGNFVRIAAHVVVIPGNHVFADANVPIAKQGVKREGITIEDDVWIGAHATILDGVRIGRGTVVAAGAVVTKSFEPYSIIAGVPATLIGRRGSEPSEDLRTRQS